MYYRKQKLKLLGATGQSYKKTRNTAIIVAGSKEKMLNS